MAGQGNGARDSFSHVLGSMAAYAEIKPLMVAETVSLI